MDFVDTSFSWEPHMSEWGWFTLSGWRLRRLLFPLDLILDFWRRSFASNPRRFGAATTEVPKLRVVDGQAICAKLQLALLWLFVTRSRCLRSWVSQLELGQRFISHALEWDALCLMFETCKFNWHSANFIFLEKKPTSKISKEPPFFSGLVVKRHPLEGKRCPFF